MCLIAFALNDHPDYPFILIANRDEFYERPTKAAHFWNEHPEMLAGKDLKAGGSWMGLTRNARFAAVTNYRDIKNIKPEAKSRGELVTHFLTSPLLSKEYLKRLHKNPSTYNGYNLLTWHKNIMYHYSNYQGTINKLSDGIHALSNALLDTPWPKVEKVKQDFRKAIGTELDENKFFEILGDQTIADDADLPQTGLPHDLEKAVSAVCIRTEKYGTVSSSIVLISKDGEANFIEKTYAVGGREEGTRRFSFTLSL